jgi:NADPH-dependent glutamate synthase beta subunit-like oxidoreductase
LQKKKNTRNTAGVVRERAPLPLCLGYICTHACELDCKRTHLNQSVAIRDIKRYAAERDEEQVWKNHKTTSCNRQKSCCYRAGPAGVIAAYYLKKQGHDVTVKEALPKAGGLLQYGIHLIECREKLLIRK